jgi:hypothetical protein
VSNKIEFDTRLPRLSVWAIDDDAICMDMGSKTYEDITDQQAIMGLRKLRWKMQARMDAIDRELERLVERNEPTEHRADELRSVFAKADKYFREEYPRALEIALAEAGIEAK